MNDDPEKTWSLRVLGGTGQGSPILREVLPVYSDDVPTLKEENAELKRLIRDLVHFDVAKSVMPKRKKGEEDITAGNEDEKNTMKSGYQSGTTKSGSQAMSSSKHMKSGSGGGLGHHQKSAKRVVQDGDIFEKKAEEYADQSNIPKDMIENGFRDLPLPIQAEIMLLNMQRRFNSSSNYIKENCTVRDDITVQDVISQVTATNQIAQLAYAEWQYDRLDCLRFEWTANKKQKIKTIEALENLVTNLDGDLHNHQSTHTQLANVRKQVCRKIAKQQKDGLQWRNTRGEMNKHLSCLEHCYEYISNPSYNFIREHSRESYVPQIIKGMRVTISELMRQNRELELKLHFAERQKKRYINKIKSLYEEQVRQPVKGNAGPTTTQGVLIQFGNSGSSSSVMSEILGSKLKNSDGKFSSGLLSSAGLTSGSGSSLSGNNHQGSSSEYLQVATSPDGGKAVPVVSKRKINLDEVIWPGTSSWRGPNLDKIEIYVPITRPNARGRPVQFLNFLLACHGHFPFEYLFAVSKDDLRDCINFLGAEYVENVLRTKGLECAFQNLQETRFLIDINAAVRYLVASISCVLRCDRASYWIVDINRGFAWTKSAGGTGMAEICIPLDVGLIGEAITTSRAVNVADAYLHAKFNKAIDMRTGYRTRSVLCVPIIVKGKTVAVIQAINKLSMLGCKKGNKGNSIHPNPIFDERDVFMLHVLGYGMTDVVLSCEEIELDTQINRRKDLLIAATGDLFLHCDQKSDLLLMLNKYLANLFRAKQATIILLYYDHMSRLELDENGDIVEKVCLDKTVGLAGLCVQQRTSLHCGNIKEDPRYRPDLIDLVVQELKDETDKVATVALHSWPLYRGRLLSAVIQWSCEQRSRVDFGDDGSFNEQSNRHADLLHKMLILIQVYLEIWFPTLERLQSGIQKRAKKGLKVARLVKMQGAEKVDQDLKINR